MRTSWFALAAVAALASVPMLVAQEDAGSDASESAKTTYAPAPAGWGDNAASHAWEMSTISGRLENRLDATSAKVGDRVVLKTTEKAQTSDGTVIPNGARLMGHVTEVQEHDKTHPASQIGIAFDRVEIKGGQSVAIYTMIRGLTPAADLAAGGGMYGEEQMSAGRGAGRMGGGALDAGGLAEGVADRTAATASSMGARAGAGVDSTASAAVQRAGHGDLNLNTGAHALAATRATPHPTGIPGVMLAGSSTASGMLSAPGRNLELESGTRLLLGIVANR